MARCQRLKAVYNYIKEGNQLHKNILNIFVQSIVKHKRARDTHTNMHAHRTTPHHTTPHHTTPHHTTPHTHHTHTHTHTHTHYTRTHDTRTHDTRAHDTHITQYSLRLPTPSDRQCVVLGFGTRTPQHFRSSESQLLFVMSFPPASPSAGSFPLTAVYPGQQISFFPLSIFFCLFFLFWRGGRGVGGGWGGGS